MTDAADASSRRKTGADTEAKLVTLSTQLFTDLGYERVTTRMIAEACDITVPTIYLYFKDKRALYIRCCVDVFTRNSTRLNAIMTADVPADQRVYGAALELARILLEDPHLCRLLQRELADGDFEGLKILDEASFAEPLELMQKNVVEALGYEPPPLTALSIFGLGFGLVQYRQITDEVDQTLAAGSGTPTERMARHVLQIVVPEIHDRLFS